MQMIRPMMGMPGMGMPGMRPQMMVHQPMFMQQQNMPRPLFMQHPGRTLYNNMDPGTEFNEFELLP